MYRCVALLVQRLSGGKVTAGIISRSRHHSRHFHAARSWCGRHAIDAIARQNLYCADCSQALSVSPLTRSTLPRPISDRSMPSDWEAVII
jgi:hypothetical protein